MRALVVVSAIAVGFVAAYGIVGLLYWARARSAALKRAQERHDQWRKEQASIKHRELQRRLEAERKFALSRIIE